MDNEIKNQEEKIDSSKRSLLKASYVAPAIITLSALPSFASAGSGYNNGGGGWGGGGSHYEKKKKFFEFLIQLFKKWR